MLVKTRLLCLCLLLMSSVGYAQPNKTNPNSGINWLPATGSTAPSATCQATYTGPGTVSYGTPYTDTTHNVSYVCSSSGWLSNVTGAFLPLVGGHVTGTLTAPKIDGFYAVDGTTYTTISAALAAAQTAGGGTVWIPCGSYTDTLVINTSNITLQGQGRQCTVINPSGNNPVITFAAGASGSGINYDVVEDLSINNVASTGDGIQFTGGLNVPNDHTTVQRVVVVGFRYDLNIIGRAIWDNFLDDDFQNATIANVYTNSAAAINRLTFEGGRNGGGAQYGVYFVNTSANGALGIAFHNYNVENNGTSALDNCAGMYLNGIASGSITGASYFEANCLSSTGGLNGADIRLDGSFVQSFDIQDALIWSVTSYGIYNTATTTTGDYHGNKIVNQTSGIPILVSSASSSNIHVGVNFLTAGAYPSDIADSNSNHHMSGSAPFTELEGGAGQAGNTINPVTAGVANCLNYDVMNVFNGPFTITNIAGYYPGRRCTIRAFGSTVTLSTGGAGLNSIWLKGGAASEVIPSGDSVTLEYSGVYSQWREMVPSAANGGGGGGGGTVPNMVVVTANYPVPQTSLWVRANCSAPCTITLPGAVTTGFNVLVEKYPGSAAVTISPNGVTYDGITNQLQDGQSTYVSTDGTAYHSTLPYSSLPAVVLVPTATNAAAGPNLIAQSAAATRALVFNDLPWTLDIPAANCNNTTFATGWSLPASGAASAACRTGTNINAGVLQFAASNSAQFQIELPNDYDSSGTVYAKISFTQGSSTTSGQTIIMQLATMCPGTTDDAAFNSAQAFSAVTTTTVANAVYAPTLSNVTMTGCTAGEPLNVKISRSGSDTATTPPNVYYVTLTIPRAPVMQAN